jgi:ATP-dependent Clp protease ATP-binding subunit ClpA
MLEPRNVVVEYDDEVVDWLTNKGFTPTMGARPMARLINEKIKKPLAKKILFGKDVDLVKLKVINNGINIQTDKIQT